MSVPVATSDDASSTAHLVARVAELASAVAMRDGFLGAASHELRNAMAPLVLLVDAGGASSERRHAVLARSVKRLGDVVERVAEIAQLRAGKLAVKREPTDLAALVREVVAMQDPSATVGIDAPAPVVGDWDPALVRQLVRHLVANALAHGRTGVTVEVRADARGGVLVVADAGPGIAPARRAHLFEPFDETVGTPPPGTLGIGLWVIKRLCDEHGGSVALEDSAQGARFRVVLPRG